MNYTFHLTSKCNLNCRYCYEGEKGTSELSFEQIKMVMDREAQSGTKICVITFFGGEPLLKKDLIAKVVDYAKELQKSNDIKYRYTITTNGTLIDKDFIKLAKNNDFLIGYSLDGKEETQNKNRVNYLSEGSFDIVYKNAKDLLKSVKRVVAMPVVTRNNFQDMAENVKFLFDMGFRYVNCAFDYCAQWTDEEFVELRKSYEKLAELYYEKSKKNNKFYLLPFENKISNYIKDKSCNEHCKLALKSVNVSSLGKIYPCMQFVGKDEYEIGDVENGIDNEKRENLRSLTEPLGRTACDECKISRRCSHTCGCLNIITTGTPRETSALVCELERMIIEISDSVAARLYKEGIQSFYEKEYCNNWE